VLVELPTGSDVQGDTAKGGYLVEGAVGSCRLKTATADIRVEQATSVWLKTTGGTVIVDHVAWCAATWRFRAVRPDRPGARPQPWRGHHRPPRRTPAVAPDRALA
jgi:hypothetical protein